MTHASENAPKRPALPLATPIVAGLVAILCGIGCAAHRGTTNVNGSGQGTPGMRDNRELSKRGREAMRAGDSIRAEHYFALAIQNGYDESELLPELLTACLLTNRLRSALNYAEPALRKHPADSVLRYLVATVHLGLGQIQFAKQELETLLRHQPQFADAHFLLGMLELSLNEGEAERHFRVYLKLAPRGNKTSEALEHIEQLQYSRTPYATATEGGAMVSSVPSHSDSGSAWTTPDSDREVSPENVLGKVVVP